MNETPLTKERILEAAEDVLRRYGLSKATVVDVARALNVSHGSVYKHFASKADLRDAVTKVWLSRIIDPLSAIITDDALAADRMHRWLVALITAKRSRLFDDPELFATYCELTSEARSVVAEHVDHMAAQVSQIVCDGVSHGEFASKDPAATGRAILSATARFHNPIHAGEWSHPDIDIAFDEVWALILSGLKPREKNI